MTFILMMVLNLATDLARETSNEEIIKNKKKTQKRKITVAKMTTEPITKKKKKQQKGIIDYINS